MNRKDAADSAGLSRTTAHNISWHMIHCSEEQDVLNLLSIRKGRGGKNPLQGIEESILKDIDTHDFFTMPEIADHIKMKYGASVSLKYMKSFLNKHGITKKKSGSLPAKADTEAQRNFYDEILHPHMESAALGKAVLLFSDASHFVFGCDFMGAVYSRNRRFTRTFSGRQRYNVLGTVDFCTKEVITYTNTDYINAESVCSLLGEIRDRYGDRKVIMVLDNARCQKCELVLELASSLDIELLFLPPYSPNLNLIEKL